MEKPKATREDFELESGLPDDFDAAIVRSWFGYKAEYQKGEVPLLLLDLEGEEIEPTNVAFSIGADWKIVEGGNRVEHPKGKKRFVVTSRSPGTKSPNGERGAKDKTRRCLTSVVP